MKDVAFVRCLLSSPTKRRKISLPVELVDYILDLAEYWVSQTTTLERPEHCSGVQVGEKTLSASSRVRLIILFQESA